MDIYVCSHKRNHYSKYGTHYLTDNLRLFLKDPGKPSFRSGSLIVFSTYPKATRVPACVARLNHRLFMKKSKAQQLSGYNTKVNLIVQLCSMHFKIP